MNLSPGILIIFGIGIFGGILSAVVVKKLNIPQVLGYILIGIVIGTSGFKIVTNADIDLLRPFNFFALGIIGFLVGAEIHFDTLKKYRKQFSTILLSEGILAFLLVCIPITLIMLQITNSLHIALATGIVFGAIASATDPASTINVLWEYRAAGILTTTLIAIVALDDALAMTLYGIGTSVAQILSGSDSQILQHALLVLLKLLGSVGMGIAAGFLLYLILRKSNDQDYVSTLAIGILFLCIGFSVKIDIDVILVTMSLGITVVNASPHRSKELINHLKRLSSPIYILFFVLVGARLGIAHMPLWLWLTIVLYIIGRSAGKMVGAWLGAKLTKAEDVIRKYVGMGLFAQGGVAIGLSIMASQHLNTISINQNLHLGDVIIFGITATTFIVQIIGPPLVKVAIRLSGEIGKNITREDIIAEWKVGDVMNDSVKSLKEDDTVRSALLTLQDTGHPFLPIIDDNNTIKGIISFDQIRDIILDDSVWDWVLVSDIMSPAPELLTKTQPLAEALQIMNQLYVDYLPVVRDIKTKVLNGILDRRQVNISINRKLISTRTTARS